MGPQEPSLWTETSIHPPGIWQYQVSNLWISHGTNLGHCAPQVWLQHTCPNFCLIHFCQSLLSLQLSLQFPLKDRTQFKGLEQFFQTWMFSTQRKPEGSPSTQTHPKSLSPQTCCELGALVFLHQQTESPSNTVGHQPLPGHSLFELLSVTQSKNSLRTISRTALKIVLSLRAHICLLDGGGKRTEQVFHGAGTAHKYCPWHSCAVNTIASSHQLPSRSYICRSQINKCKLEIKKLFKFLASHFALSPYFPVPCRTGSYSNNSFIYLHRYKGCVQIISCKTTAGKERDLSIHYSLLNSYIHFNSDLKT